MPEAQDLSGQRRNTLGSLTGHACELPEGHLLVAKCIERGEKGFLDALCLSEEQCDQCVEDRREALRRELSLCADAGCPMGEGDCKGQT